VVLETLPLALAIAASPFPIIPAILLLFTPRAQANAASFLAGWVIGITAATSVFVLLATVVDALDDTPTWASWTRIVLGLLLVGVGVRQWLTRALKDSTPAWMRSIEQASPRSALRLGLVLSALNPKVLLLAGAAGLAIGSADLSAANATVSVLAFTAVAASTVAIPVVLHAIAGERLDPTLRTAQDWLRRHNAAVMALVLVAIGAALVVKGLQTL
jgi:threonine/homoserine/homoserine lactone efflux protein